MHTARRPRHSSLMAPEPHEAMDAFGAIAIDDDACHDPATAPLEHLSSTTPWRMPPASARARDLVSLIIEPDGS